MAETFEARMDRLRAEHALTPETVRRLVVEADAKLAAERAKVAEQAAHIDELVETQVYWMDQTAELRAKAAALEAERDALREALADYDAAADKFIAKVQDGRAHSRETYADLKACRAQSVALATSQKGA